MLGGKKTWLRDRTGSFFDEGHNATSHTALNTCNWKDEFACKTSSNDSCWENQEAQKQIALEAEAGSNQSSVSASIFDASSSSSERWRNCSARPVVTRGLFPGAPWEKPWLRDRIGRSFFDESHYATSPTAVNACNRKDEFEWKTSSNDIYWENQGRLHSNLRQGRISMCASSRPIFASPALRTNACTPR